MKQLIMIFTCVLIMFASCEKETNTYEIEGHIPGLENGHFIELLNGETYETIDSCRVENGNFYFKGSVERPQFAILVVDFKNYFILENANYKVRKQDSFILVEGGELNKLVFGYESEKDFIDMKLRHNEAAKEFENMDWMDKEAVDEAMEASGKWMKEQSDYIIKYQNEILEGDYPTLAKLYTLSLAYDYINYGADKKLELFKEYEKDLGAHPYLLKLRKEILTDKKLAEERKSVAPGKPFKEVVGITKKGSELKLSEVVAKNKYTLLEMWASWCGPCRGEFPHLKEAYKHYHKKGFEIYALSIDEKEKDWLKAMEEENVPWINVVDYNGFESKPIKDYVVQGIPSSFLIDQDGKIVAVGQDIRGFGLDETLEELLGK